jgi:hypothetical protein
MFAQKFTFLVLVERAAGVVVHQWGDPEEQEVTLLVPGKEQM